MEAGIGSGTHREISRKFDKKKRQIPVMGNWRHTDSMFYNCRSTGKIMPVVGRKELWRKQGFF
ncbi:MAG: hypothetical protein SOX11_03705 [Lachnospiraceae bacterium]|nr:hypothetical protein [Lachnospiraceae bacterium]